MYCKINWIKSVSWYNKHKYLEYDDNTVSARMNFQRSLVILIERTKNFSLF